MAQVTFDDQTGTARDLRPTPTMVVGNGSMVLPGELLGGRSPSERIAFLAGSAAAEPSATTAGPRPRVYRNYTRRLRDT